MYGFRILHISDLHARGNREREAWRRGRVLLDSFWRNLDDLQTDGAFDLICFTGDLADWGQAEEYEAAGTFLTEILTRLSLPKSRLFLVPGNHDIARSIAQDMWSRFRADLLRPDVQTDVSRWLAGGPVPQGLPAELRDAIIERQSAYRAFVASFGLDAQQPQLSPHNRLGYRITLRLPAMPFDIHIIGLDSAWLSGDDNDPGKLLLTEDQVMRLCTDPDGRSLSGVRVALSHHPLTDLADGAHCRRLLAQNVDLLLRGHLHSTEPESWADPDRSLIQLAVGCLYEGHSADTYPNGCQAITVNLNGQGKPLRYDLRLRAFSPRGGHWHDDNSLYEAAKQGRLSLDASGHVLAVNEQPRSHVPSIKAPFQHAPASLEQAVRQYKEYTANQIVLFRDLGALLVSGRAMEGAKALSLFAPQKLHPEDPPGQSFTVADRVLSESQSPWLVILGTIGSGKSVLLRWLCHKVCVEGGGAIGLPTDVVPVLIELKEFYKSGCATFYEYFDRAYDGFALRGEHLRQLEREGRLLWLLDGLDEITASDGRRDAVNRIARLIATGKGRGVLTSRPEGADYAVAQLRRLAAHIFSIHEYELSDMLDFLRRWHHVVEDGGSTSLPLSQRLGRALQDDPRLFDICRSPLILAVSCWLNRHGALPPQRRLLYERALQYLTFEWEFQKRGDPIGEPSPEQQHLLDYLRSLAWHMQSGTKDQPEILIPEDRLLAFSIEYFKQHSRPPGQAMMSARRIVLSLRDRCLLVPRGENSFAFVHRAFQEYLAAEFFLLDFQRGKYQVADLIHLFRSRWQLDSWQETLALLCAGLEEESSRQLVDTFQMIAEEIPIVWGEDFDFECFALKCMSELQHPEAEPWRSFAVRLLEMICSNVSTHFERSAFSEVEKFLLPALRRFGPRWPDQERWVAWAQEPSLKKRLYVARGRAYRCILATCDRHDRATLLCQILKGEAEREAAEAALREMTALGWTNTETDMLSASLSELPEDVGISAAQELARLGNPPGENYLRKILLRQDKPSSRLRASVALAIAHRLDQDVLTNLRSLLQPDANLYPAQQSEAVDKLQDVAWEPAIRSLLLDLAEHEPSLSQAAIVAFRKVSLDKREASILQTLADSSPWAVADALGAARHLEELTQILEQATSPRARLYAASWLNRLGRTETATPILRALITDAKDDELRLDAAEQLASVASCAQEAQNFLLQLAKSDAHRNIRLRAAHRLSLCPAPTMLLDLLTSDDEWVRFHAAVGLLGRASESTRLVHDDVVTLHEEYSRGAFLRAHQERKTIADAPAAKDVLFTLARAAKDDQLRLRAALHLHPVSEDESDKRKQALYALLSPAVEPNCRLSAACALARPRGLDRDAYRVLRELSEPTRRIGDVSRPAMGHLAYLQKSFLLCQGSRKGRRAVVSLTQVTVGLLEEVEAGSRFTYDSLYLLRDDRQELSPEMPLRRDSYESPGLIPFFANFSEGAVRLDVKTTASQHSLSDAFGSLLAIGRAVQSGLMVEPAPEGEP